MVKTPIRKISLMLYYDYKYIFKKLSSKQAQELIIAMIEYDENNITPKLDKTTDIAFSLIKQRIDRDKQLYEERCKANKRNIQKRWNKSNSQNTNEYERIQSDTNEFNRIRTDTNYTDIEREIDIEKDRDIEKNINSERENIKREKPTGFTPPTLTEIINFAKSIDFNDEEYCERFYNHYQSVGWVNGAGNKIQDWKLLFKNWVKKDKEKSKPQKSKMDLVFEQFLEEEND